MSLSQQLTGRTSAKAKKDAATPTAPAETPAPRPELRPDDTAAAPAFPIEVFPPRIQGVINDCRQYMSYPADITAASILAAASLAIARTHRIYYQGDWTEAACMYMAIVAPPGSAKSHPLKFALTPIIERNKQAIKDFIAQQTALATEGVADYGKMRDKQCLFSDFTIEALAKAVQNNPRGISVYLDELRAWFANFNRYNAGSEMETWLTNWSGGSWAITRVGRKMWLESPSISVVGTVQPSVLEDMGKGGRNQNGFIERILFVYPDYVPVLNVLRRSDRSDTRSIMLRQYAPVLNTMLDWQLAIEGEGTEEVAHQVVFSPEADDHVTDFINWLKKELSSIDNEYLRNVYSKMQTYTLRFCLIINRLDYACAVQTNQDFPPLDDYTVKYDQACRACLLIEYFLAHSKKANVAINAQTPLQRMPKDEITFYRNLPLGEAFTTAQAEDAAAKARISRAKMYRMLNEPEPTKRIFQKLSHGVYERLFA